MSGWGPSVFVLSGLVAAACGGGSGGAGMDAGGNAAACVLGQLTLVGELDVRSRDEVVRIEFEWDGVAGPGIADGPIRRAPA